MRMNRNLPITRRPVVGLRTVGFICAFGFASAFGMLSFAHSEAAAQSQNAGQTAAAQKSAAPAGNAQHGKAVYTADGCYECHGRDAQGGAATGPRLGPNPIPFNAFVFQVRSPRNEMPPYTAKVLTDSDLADIYAFVQSLPQPPKAESIPLLK